MRLLSYFFLILWIVLFPIIAGVVSYNTKNDSYYYLALISIICVFNLVWFVLNRNNPKMDIVSKIGNLLVLNVFAYFSIKKAYEISKVKKVKKDQENRRYAFSTHSQTNAQNKKPQIEDFDFDFTDDELKTLKTKQDQRLQEIPQKEAIKQLNNALIEADRKIIWGFGVYLLFLIYEQNPAITNTYEIIKSYQTSVDDTKQLTKNIQEFSLRKDLAKFIPDYNPNSQVEAVLLATPSVEFKVALKQDRVDMEIRAKKVAVKKNKAS